MDPAPEIDTRKWSPQQSPQERPWLIQRTIAALEVVLCSDYPTQLALGAAMAAFGFRPLAPNGQLAVGPIIALELADTVLLLWLIFFFLRAHGERGRDVLAGGRSIAREATAGIPLTIVAVGIGVGVLLIVQRFAPSLHTVARNPFQDLLRTPGQAAPFAVIVVVAGGLREEIQRAFLLHRFDVWLGGGVTGLVLTSVAFGAGHFEVQGADAAIATGALGAFWGLVYLRRRSAAAPVVSHAGFNLLQIVQFLLAARLS